MGAVDKAGGTKLKGVVAFKFLFAELAECETESKKERRIFREE
jgi:hypothetical protein